MAFEPMTTQGRVLLVEDEETLAATLSEMIRRRGYECEIAGSVDAGLARLQQGNFDTVVTDIHLPDGNNLEMLEAIQRIPGTPPVIITTGFPSLENALQAIERHAFAYRIKPFDFNEMLDLIEQAIGHGRLRSRVGQSAQRIADLAASLEKLRSGTARASRDGLDQSVIDYLLLLLGNNAETLSEAMDILHSMVGERASRPIRTLSQHPEAEMFKAAVAHTINVLESTRRSFKSRELAELRQQLEVALAATKGGSRPD